MSGFATVESGVLLYLMGLRLRQEGLICEQEREILRDRAERGESPGVLVRELWGSQATSRVLL